jgi:hypothetical protein
MREVDIWMKWHVWRRVLLRSLTVGLAVGYFLGLIRILPGESGIGGVMSSFYSSLVIGIVIGLILSITVEQIRRGKGLLDVMLVASLFLYLGFIKTLGWSVIPWVALTLALFAGLIIWFLGIRVGEVGIVLLLHGMGYMSGLYLFLHLRDYLKGWDSTVANLGMLVRWIVL